VSPRFFMDIPSGFVEALGWTLVHFIWQGATLALALYVFMAYCRSAVTRYWAGVVTLALMAAAPVLTITVIRHAAEPGAAASAYVQTNASLASGAGTQAGSAFAAVANSLPSINWPTWFAAMWFIGVLVFALRALGGWILVQRLYRRERHMLTPLLAARCAALRERLGVSRTVKFYLSHTIDAPAVIGWFRPIVLLPFTALTGLSPEQLEAIIVHELAHIRRLDCFVNLFQIAAETLLFYHPAVWWVSGTVRAERENCCDDIAVAVCGDAGIYARALTVVEGWRAMPVLVMAANSSPLKLRVERLLGVKAMTSNVSSAGITAVGLICATGVLLAGTALQQAAPQRPSAAALPVQTTRKPIAAMPAQAGLLASVDPVAQRDAKATPVPAQAPGSDPTPKPSSYIEGLRAAGLNNIDVDQLIALKVQGVTPQYIREIHSAGLTPNIGEIIAMKVQRVTPEYIHEVRQSWPDTKIGEIIAMKVQGVHPSDAAGYRSVGLEKLNVGQLIAFRVQGVTPEYVRNLKAAGFADLTTDNVIAAKVQGITPEFVQKVRAHGFTKLSLSQLIGLKTANVF
jgi:beta-lactamase regulating signal transducer with metallopeptidase domain